MKFVAHLDGELPAVEDDGDRRVAAGQDVGDGRAGGPGPARRCLPHPPLEDAGSDPVGRQGGEPGDVGPVGESLVVLDRGTDRRQVERASSASSATAIAHCGLPT